MNTFKRIMVGLDLSNMDNALLQFIKEYGAAFGMEKIYFFHSAKSLEISDEIRKRYPELLAPTDEAIKAQIENLLKSELGTFTIEYEILIMDGSPIDNMLRWIKIKEIDLLLVGRKIKSTGSGLFSRTMARKAPCSVLFVPEITYHKLHNILVPLDFSKHSKLSYSIAKHIQSVTKSKVTALHIYEVPNGYSKLGKTFEEFADIMHQNAEESFQRFVHPEKPAQHLFKTSLKKSDQRAADLVFAAADEIKADMLLIGSKGRTDAASVLIGSMAEAIIKEEKHQMPILIVKQKGENMSFLQALLKI